MNTGQEQNIGLQKIDQGECLADLVLVKKDLLLNAEIKQGQNIGLQKIDEATYKADLILLEKYQSFSSEIIRLSLLGIAGLAFFLKEIMVPDTVPISIKQSYMITFLLISSFLFILSTGFGLWHRYVSSDGFFYHLRSLRHENADCSDKAERDSKIRNGVYNKAEFYLISSTILFWFAGISLCISFMIFPFAWNGVNPLGAANHYIAIFIIILNLLIPTIWVIKLYYNSRQSRRRINKH